MSKNASHIVIHHHWESDGALSMHTVCCIVLIVVTVVILLIILAIATYLIVYKTNNRNRCDRRISSDLFEDRRRVPRAVFNNYKEGATIHGVSNSRFEDYNTTDVNSNVRNIPLSRLKNEMEARRADTSESSAGLCEVLFPPKHEGEVIYHSPTNAETYDSGRVINAVQSDNRNLSDPVPTGSRSASTNASLDWDYFESRRYRGSSASNEAELDGRSHVNICWV